MKKTLGILLAMILILGTAVSGAETTINSDSIGIQAFLADPVTLTEVSAGVNTILKGKSLSFTARTSENAAFLNMYTENGKLFKTWKADGNSSVTDGVRTWKVSLSFGGAGNRTMTFKAADSNKAESGGKAVSFIVAGTDVNSVEIAKDTILKGQTQVFTVRTGASAKILQMYNGNETKAFKTWNADGYSVPAGAERIWTVSVTFNGAGQRNQVFKAGDSASSLSKVSKSIQFTVEDNTTGVANISVTSSSLLKGQEQEFTIRTDTGAQYLMMHIEDGSLFQTWTANQNSKVEGKERIWTIRMKFNGAGNRNLTFKAAKEDKTPYPLTKAVQFTVVNNDAGVNSVQAACDPLLKGQTQVFTVRTSANAKYLMMYNGSEKKAFKTWEANNSNSTVSGTERIWTVSLAFNGAGNRTQVFKAGKTKDAPSSTSKSVKFTVDSNDTGVISIQTANDAAIKGYPFDFTITTNADAQYLMLYIEDGSLFKTWTADSSNSKVNGKQRTWTISMSFNGTGNRSLTFKAGKTKDKPTAAGKNKEFKVAAYGVISAAAASNTIARKTDLKFTVKTPSDAGYLMIYTEDGKLFKTWTADSKNSSVSNNIKTWTVSLSFNGAGDRNLTFRTGKTKTADGAGAAVPFSVLQDEFDVNKGVLVGYHGTATNITIPSDKGITAIGTDAFRGNHTAATIVIPDGVTTIQDRAFEYCDTLKTVTVPKTLKTAGAYSFNQCYKLSAVSGLENTGLTAIAEGMFCECKGLGSISLPSAITKIGRRAFYFCTNLKNMN